MRLILGTVLALSCFAGNSLLCRLALRGGEINGASFTTLRIASGALLLLPVQFARGGIPPVRSLFSALALFGYAAFFSFSYLRIGAGMGALLLFGSVQATMIGWGILRERARPGVRQSVGILIALAGLVVLTAPGASAPDATGAGLMVASGVCWGIYSLMGRGARDPILETARNFLIASLPAFLLLLLAGHFQASNRGVGLAVLSGTLTSALGYCAWYWVLPGLGAMRAAVLQLAVPVLAILAAAGLLSEPLGIRIFCAATMTLAGIWVTVLKR